MWTDKHKAVIGLFLLVQLFYRFTCRIAVFEANVAGISKKIV